MNSEQSSPLTRGLRRYSAPQRAQFLKEFAQSQLSRREFCARHGINLTTFHGWFKKPPVPTPAFTKLKLAGPTAAPIEVTLPNGVRVAIRDHDNREELIALIRGVAGC